MSITDRAAGNEIGILTPNGRYSFVWQWFIENNSDGIWWATKGGRSVVYPAHPVLLNWLDRHL